jgi:hypothetical protein
LHAYALDCIWCAIDRTSLLLSSFDFDGATDPVLKPVIDRTSLLLSSFESDGATNPALKPAIDPMLDCTRTVLKRTDPVLNLLIA